MNCKEKLLEVRDLHKVYTKEGVPTKALNGITFNVLNGEYLGIMGASGSGKTTLLNCIATVIKPTAGQILLSGANISSFDGGKLAEYRGNKIGYLFQDFALLDNLTGRENILLPLSIHNMDISTAEKRLTDIAGFVSKTINTRNIFAFAVITPIAIELLQPVIGRSFDVDDVMMNFAGIIIGYFITLGIKATAAKR